MNKFNVSILIGIVVVALFVLQATSQTASLVLLPSEVAAKGIETELKRIRVAGTVADSVIDYAVEPEIKLSFFIKDPKSQEASLLPVVYNGLKPDMFAPGRDVIIDGDFSEGRLRASKLMTQCPSKYEPPTTHPSANQAAVPKKG